MLEEGLGFALRLPAWLPEEALASEAARKAFLGKAYDDLEEYLRTAFHHLNRMVTNHRLEFRELGRLREAFLISIETWAGRASHSTRRREFIDLLIDLRAGVIERLKVIPAPETVEMVPPKWSELTSRQQSIIRVVARAGKPLSAKEVAKAIEQDADNIARDLAALTRNGILENPGKQGYSLRITPEGIPDDLFADRSPSVQPTDKPVSD